MTTGLGINVEAVTTLGRKVTLYSISPFEQRGAGGKLFIYAFTIDETVVRIDTEEAKRVRRTANKSHEQGYEGDG